MEQFTTKELVEELVKRIGVEEVLAEVEDRYDVKVTESNQNYSETTFGLGPARILIVTD
ncbi:BC1881 family protein [Macrococcus brunensis]|uniref:BC1881 family protein n=1 Tax=Macrococcus brunensis TaxID=198483 RepID=UPI001EF08118|nr:BC1881 family protein [Macrococcus brunensis]ULG72975.1 BC1881 family protein [Macrococcus brunensis]